MGEWRVVVAMVVVVVVNLLVKCVKAVQRVEILIISCFFSFGSASRSEFVVVMVFFKVITLIFCGYKSSCCGRNE